MGSRQYCGTRPGWAPSPMLLGAPHSSVADRVRLGARSDFLPSDCSAVGPPLVAPIPYPSLSQIAWPRTCAGAQHKGLRNAWAMHSAVTQCWAVYKGFGCFRDPFPRPASSLHTLCSGDSQVAGTSQPLRDSELLPPLSLDCGQVVGQLFQLLHSPFA